MNIEEYIKDKVFDILKNDNLNIEIPPKSEMGDFSLPCFTLRNEELKNPNDVSKYLKENFNDDKKIFKEIKVMGPYLNFFLDKDKFSNDVIKKIEKEKEHYGSRDQGKNENLLIEHTSINPNASPHIGRSRNALIGDFISRLYKFVGYNVERHYFVNDIGKQISMLLVGINHYDIKNPNFKDMLDLYVKINEEAEENKELEKEVFHYLNELENGNKEVRDKFRYITDLCVAGQMEILKELDISFDIFTHESDFVFDDSLDNIIENLNKSKRLEEDENGRYYVNLEDYDIPTKSPVLVLTREDKTSLYPLRDIAYTIYKINRNSKNNKIVLGEDQKVYMMQIAAVMDILGFPSPELTSYSFVLLSGSKMATRKGKVVLLEDFIKETKEVLKQSFKERNLELDEEKLRILSSACIKYAILNVSREKNVNFNLEEATRFTGDTAIYILYSIVRMNSILEKEKDFKLTKDLKFNHDIEFSIIKDLYKFENIVDSLLKNKESSTLTTYLFELTKKFSKYYEEVNIKDEEDKVLKSSRLRLLKSMIQVLSNALGILGIKTVDKM